MEGPGVGLLAGESAHTEGLHAASHLLLLGNLPGEDGRALGAAGEEAH